jgi:predicted HAD superfamily Cof-like phosphohydrolase
MEHTQTLEELEARLITRIEQQNEGDPERTTELKKVVRVVKTFIGKSETMFRNFLNHVEKRIIWAAPEMINSAIADFFIGMPEFTASLLTTLMWEVNYFRTVGRNAGDVRAFTEGAFGKRPAHPEKPLDRAGAEFIVGMVISEMVELLQTVLEPGEDAIEVVRGLCDRDHNTKYVKPSDPTDLIAEQADAMVDATYYLYDMGSRMGVNLDKVFSVVHAANMAKRDPTTDTFRKREDGKILKPDGWKEPDIRAEIDAQMRDGAWST